MNPQAASVLALLVGAWMWPQTPKEPVWVAQAPPFGSIASLAGFPDLPSMQPVAGPLVTTGAGTLAALGIGLPDNSQRWAYLATPVLQGTIAAGTANTSGASNSFVPALQLLGIFFLVSRAAGLAHVAIDSYFVGAEWQIRSSQLTAGAIEGAAGL